MSDSIVRTRSVWLAVFVVNVLLLAGCPRPSTESGPSQTSPDQSPYGEAEWRDELFDYAIDTMLNRSEDPEDRRAKKIEMTPEGRAFIEQSIEERYRWVDQLEENISEEEKAKVAEALSILEKTMRRVESGE